MIQITWSSRVFFKVIVKRFGVGSAKSKRFSNRTTFFAKCMHFFFCVNYLFRFLTNYKIKLNMDRHFVSLEFLSGPADRFCYNPK